MNLAGTPEACVNTAETAAGGKDAPFVLPTLYQDQAHQEKDKAETWGNPCFNQG